MSSNWIAMCSTSDWHSLLSQEYKLGTSQLLTHNNTKCLSKFSFPFWLKVTLALRFFRFLMHSLLIMFRRVMITNPLQIWLISDTNCACSGWHWGTHMLWCIRVSIRQLYWRVVYIAARRCVIKTPNYPNLQRWQIDLEVSHS